MDAQVIAWALGAAGATGLAVQATVGRLYRDLVAALKRQALSSETARIAAEEARLVAERHAGELEIKYGYLKQSYKQSVEALNRARVWVDPGAMVGKVGDAPQWDDPSAVWHVEGARQVGFFLDPAAEREEAERRRQRPLNPEADRRERERIDELQRRYLDSSDPPPGSDPPR